MHGNPITYNICVSLMVYLVLFFFSNLINLIFSGCSPPCTGTDVCSSNLCGKPNDGTQPCISLSECADSSSKGICSTTCQCNTGYMWSYREFTCLLPNDGVSACSDVSQCMDKSLVFGVCSGGVCTCQGFTWVASWLGCGSLNNGDPSQGWCTETLWCVDYVNGYCDLGSQICYCNTGYSWDTVELTCRAINDGTVSCNALSECADHSNRGNCNGLCTCNPACTYNSGLNLCIAPNNNTFECDSINECLDSSANGLCSTYCTCATGYGYKSSVQICVPINDNTHPCTTLADCLDDRVNEACV